MTVFTDADRGRLKEKLDAIDKAREPIRMLMKPLREAMEAIDALHEAAVEEAGVELLDEVCEGCDIMLIKGDLAHQSSDGVTLCADCSPTWANILEQYRQPDFVPEDAEAHADGLAAAEAAVEAGDGDKKHVWPL